MTCLTYNWTFVLVMVLGYGVVSGDQTYYDKGVDPLCDLYLQFCIHEETYLTQDE